MTGSSRLFQAPRDRRRATRSGGGIANAGRPTVDRNSLIDGNHADFSRRRDRQRGAPEARPRPGSQRLDDRRQRRQHRQRHRHRRQHGQLGPALVRHVGRQLQHRRAISVGADRQTVTTVRLDLHDQLGGTTATAPSSRPTGLQHRSRHHVRVHRHRQPAATPTRRSAAAWSTAAARPTSSAIETSSPAAASSPTVPRRSTSAATGADHLPRARATPAPTSIDGQPLVPEPPVPPPPAVPTAPTAGRDAHADADAARPTDGRRPRRSSGKVLVKVPGSGKFVPLDASRDQDRRRGRRAQGRGRDHARRRRQGRRSSTASSSSPSPAGSPRSRSPRRSTACAKAQGRRGREEAQDAQALGRRQGQVPHQRQVQRRHRPRHQVARPGHLHGHDDTRHAGRRERPRTSSRRRRSSSARARRTSPRPSADAQLAVRAPGIDRVVTSCAHSLLARPGALLAPASAPGGASSPSRPRPTTRGRCDCGRPARCDGAHGGDGNGSTVDDAINSRPARTRQSPGALTVAVDRGSRSPGAGANATFIQPAQIAVALTVGTTPVDAARPDAAQRQRDRRARRRTCWCRTARRVDARPRARHRRRRAPGRRRSPSPAAATASTISAEPDRRQHRERHRRRATPAAASSSRARRSGHVTIQRLDDLAQHGADRAAASASATTRARRSALRGVTLARNNARGRPPAPRRGRAVSTNAASARSRARSSPQQRDAASWPARQRVRDCSFATAAIDERRQRRGAADCGLARDHQNADPLLAPRELDTSAQPPVLPIPANSPAVDIAPCGTRHSTSAASPARSGARCDAGAYEVPAPLVAPTPTPTRHAGRDSDADADARRTPTPVRNKSVVAKPVSGKVLVKVPGAKTFVPLLDASR